MLKARTGDGSIRVQVEPETVMSDAWDISTGDGSVTLACRPRSTPRSTRRPVTGRCGRRIPALKIAEHEGEGRREARRELRTKMGEGGPVLRVRTSDGTIRFER